MNFNLQSNERIFYVIGLLLALTYRIHLSILFFAIGFFIITSFHVFWIYGKVKGEVWGSLTPSSLALVFVLLINQAKLNAVQIMGINGSNILLFLWTVVLILWIVPLLIADFRNQYLRASLSFKMNKITLWVYRLAFISLLLSKWFGKEVVLEERVWEYVLLATMLLLIVLAILIDKSIRIDERMIFGEFQLESFGYLFSTLLSQTVVLGLLLLFNAVKLVVFRQIWIVEFILVVVLLLRKHDKLQDLESQLNRVSGVNYKEVERLVQREPRELTKLIEKKGLKVMSPTIAEELTVPVGTIITPLKQSLLAINPNIESVQLLPKSFNKKFKTLLRTKNEVFVTLQESDVQTLRKYSNDIKNALVLASNELEMLRDNLAQELSKFTSGKGYVIRDDAEGTIVKLPGISVIENKTEQQTIVKTPFVTVIEKEKEFSFVKTFGLRIFDDEKTGNALVDGWIKVLDLGKFTYVNVLGFIRVISDEKHDFHFIKIFGVPIKSGHSPPEIQDLTFEEVEEEILQRINTFWEKAFQEILLHDRERVFHVQAGKLKTLVVSREETAKSLESDQYNVLVGELGEGTK